LKLNVLSDLHLSLGALDVPANDADVVVLAGDIGRPAEAVAWARGIDKPVLYVPGNHEFYGGSLDTTLDQLKEMSAGTNVRVLDDDVVTLDGVRFLGSTLWTDFLLCGRELTPANEALADWRASTGMRGGFEPRWKSLSTDPPSW
jgi:predicted phosphodiesterase